MRFFLIPFSLVYYFIISLRNFFYNSGIFKTHELDARVISIGNITWGGTGKTPVVASIAKSLLRKGKKPAILLRGYGRDEARLLSRLAPKLPIMPGKNRIITGAKAIKKHSIDTLLLDDGFQHRRIKRDIDIVCIDATNPFGNGLVIPAGSMREGMSALKRADIFLITKIDLVQDSSLLLKRLKKINPDSVIAKAIHRPDYFYRLLDGQPVGIEGLKNKDIALVSAIGNPVAFEKTISNLGLKFKRHFLFRDHHWYTKRDVKKIEDCCRKNNITAVITTEKDAVRLKAVSCQALSVSFVVLHIELKIIDNEQGFYDRLFGLYSS